MKKIGLCSLIIIVLCSAVSAQKLKENTGNSIVGKQKAMDINGLICKKPDLNNFQYYYIKLSEDVFTSISMDNNALKLFNPLGTEIFKPFNSFPTFAKPSAIIANSSYNASHQATSDTTFYEGWEAYNGKNMNWIPSNWTQINKTRSDTITRYNAKWFVYGGAYINGQVVRPDAGKYMAWIISDNTQRDEWLISPPFTPVLNDYLAFDLMYSAFWMYFNYQLYLQTGKQVVDFTKPTATIQLYISTDNGNNWNLFWDIHDRVKLYDNTTIYDYQKITSNSFLFSMSAYTGKSIKIVYRYVGTGGLPMALDNIGVRKLKPVAAYRRPQGYFYLGFTPDYGSANLNLLLGKSDQSDKWLNNSNGDSQSFKWRFVDPQNSDNYINTTEIEPVITYPVGLYTPPVLSASSEVHESTYVMGNNSLASAMMIGGKPAFSWGTLGAGNYDLSKKIMIPVFDTIPNQAVHDFAFGTRPNKSIEAVLNYFEKPLKPYLLDSIWVNLAFFQAPATNTPFTMNIRKYDPLTGTFSIIMATATSYAYNVRKSGDGFYTMTFKNFLTYDDNSGLQITNDFLEINDQIMVELTGFNKPNISLGVYCQSLNTSQGESNAYVYYNDVQSGKKQLLNSLDYVGVSTSLLFNLGISYPYIIPIDTVFNVPASGGSKTFKVNSFFEPVDWWLDQALPSWLSSSSTFDPFTGEVTYTLQAQALPAGVTTRSVSIKVSCFTTDMTIHVKQDATLKSNTSDNSNIAAKVEQKPNSFEIYCSKEFDKVSICTVSGQLIDSYILPSTGNFSIPKEHLQHGIYIIRLNGNSSKSWKVQK